ncbi:MAG: hypothetical protein HYR72_04820 [Deltaproteobacteria bacterium]|nr:hypothetical protein [Deltaproteobacteria bacterium]MBI3389791.1 hypothetical protein [Deltaproteobacteria bacterium]
MRSLIKIYRATADRVTGRNLDKAAARKQLRILEEIEFVCIGAVAFGLFLEMPSLCSAASLVAFGVLGEFVIHRFHVRASKREQNLSDKESNEQLAAIAEVNLKAETERLKRVEIEERRAPRRLSMEQFNIIESRLRAFAPVEIGVIPTAKGDAEPLEFAADLCVLFRKIGWLPAFATRIDHTIRLGLWVELSPNADRLAQRAAPELVVALRIAGIAVDQDVSRPAGGEFGGTGEEKERACGAGIILNVGLHPVTARGY